MKRKVGIITFNKAINFGAILQMYALQKKCRDYGNDVKIINYQNNNINETYSIIKFSKKNDKNLKGYLKKIISFPINLLKHIKFNKFINKTCLLTPKYNLQKLENDKSFDILITGSDQVWNGKLTTFEDKAYLLDFKTNARKNSYAASIGNDKIGNDDIKRISKAIKNYSNISVRENNLKNSLEKYCDKEITTVLDPVFLLKKSNWDDIISKPLIKEKYILVYTMEGSLEVKKIVNEVSNLLNLKIVTFNKVSKYNNILSNRFISGPAEFLNYLKYADFVITNSFHATAFSIIFEKQFISISHSERNSRIFELLSKLNLNERQVSTIDEIYLNRINKKIDYSESQKLLEKEILKSEEFLKKILK